jgi:hypothetical protein
VLLSSVRLAPAGRSKPHVDSAPRARCSIRRPSGGVHVTLIETVRRLLVDAPGIAACDSCLARGCSTSLKEMREITAVLLDSAGFHRHDRCWSCSRNVDAVMYRAKCVHCSLSIEPNDEAAGFGTLLFHAGCLRAVRASRKLQRAAGLSDGTRRRRRTQRRASS